MNYSIHILGICGTFMGGIALLARELGWHVTGQDAQVYPPMSTQLEAAGIGLHAGYDTLAAPDGARVVVGNVMKRGIPAVECLLDRGLDYVSGPQWLGEAVLRDRWVLAVAGTHGKTTTASMLAWILEYAGLQPGFLIGGVPLDFGVSARLGGGSFFVVEADEYDTAFFDKRSKFVHYRPRTLILNNLEFDHADIFADLAAIETQFHHLLRTVPGAGLVVQAAADAAIARVIERGCWTPRETFGFGQGDWQAAEAEEFTIDLHGQHVGTLKDWALSGRHNRANALAALAAARHVGVPVAVAVEALGQFRGVRRRMEVRGRIGGVTVYDDFAHHPTAIRTTLEGLRARLGGGRLLALLDPRSNTMRMGVHRETLPASLAAADQVWLWQGPGMSWSLEALLPSMPCPARVESDVARLVEDVAAQARPGDHVVLMSNGAFDKAHERLLDALQRRFGVSA